MCENQSQSLTHNITLPQSSIQTIQHSSMHHQHQMQQIHMHQQPKRHLFQARPSNFGNAFQMPSSQQHEVQSVVKQNSSHELMCNLNPRSKNVSPSSVISGNANITPTVPRQITLAMQEAYKRKQFGLREIKPAHCNNENSLRRRDSEPPPPAHMNCVSLKKLLRKMDRNAVKMTSTMEASCPYLQRNEPITCPPSDVKISGGIEIKALTKAHSQPPFNIAGKLIVQQLPGKTPSINRPNNEDKETAGHSSIPNTPTSATFGVQLPPRASSASDRYSNISQSIFEVGQPAITFHPNSPSSASLSRSSSSLQAFTNLSKPEESKLTDKDNTVSIAILNSHQKTEGSIKFTNTPQTIQSHDAVATTNIISQTNIIDLTKECSSGQNLNLQKDDTEKAVQLELNKAIAKRCKQDLLNTSMTGDVDLTQSDQQPSKISQQMHGMKLPLGTSNTVVLTVDNQPHVQQASLHVSPVLVSTPVIQNQQQQWQKQLLKSQGPDSMMIPSPGMHFNTVSNIQTMQTPNNRTTSGQGGRLPQLQPKVQNSMIRMIGSAAVPVNGVRMPPTAENMQINRPYHPQAMMMQGSYRLNQQHLQAQREYQNPEIMKHRTRQYIGAPRSGVMLPHQIPLHSSKEVSQDSNSFHQHPALNPSVQTNAFNQDRQQPKQITPASQAFVPISYQRQLSSSQARFAPLVSCTTTYGHGQHEPTQNSIMTENEQLPNRLGNVDNTVPPTIPVNSTSQRAQIIPTSSTETTIPAQTITSVVLSEHPITSKTNNDIFHTEVDPTSKKTEAHLQQINGSCVMCGNFSLYLCSCCKKMWYCSPQCQLKHWTTHSQECRESTAT